VYSHICKKYIAYARIENVEISYIYIKYIIIDTTVIIIIRRYLFETIKTVLFVYYTYMTPCDTPYTRFVENCGLNEKPKTAETRYSNLYKYSARRPMGRIGI